VEPQIEDPVCDKQAQHQARAGVSPAKSEDDAREKRECHERREDPDRLPGERGEIPEAPGNRRRDRRLPEHHGPRDRRILHELKRVESRAGRKPGEDGLPPPAVGESCGRRADSHSATISAPPSPAGF
jgi:hypothetical protein